MSKRTPTTPQLPIIVDIFQIRSINESKGGGMAGTDGVVAIYEGKNKVEGTGRRFFVRREGKCFSCGAQGKCGMDVGASA